ncbi:unnamed protein product [Strongylus vulgaris]|uniref:Uncharacterized protein n=1 Tax=Strongylus vulgaris TaxID=40348 RepID=A0A3P7JB00_STRVU|nr:unnamed protein product [Strongylus vulgaris]
MLRRKYGDESRLIAKFQQRLEETNAVNTGTAAQRRLLEALISLPEAHEVYLDGSSPHKSFYQNSMPQFSARSYSTTSLQECKKKAST